MAPNASSQLRAAPRVRFGCRVNGEFRPNPLAGRNTFDGRRLIGCDFQRVPTIYMGQCGQRVRRWQFPFFNAWASTVHKAQGSTLEDTVLNLGPPAKGQWQQGQACTALSRCKRGNNIHLAAFDESCLKPNRRASDEMSRLRTSTKSILARTPFAWPARTCSNLQNAFNISESHELAFFKSLKALPSKP